MLDVVEELMHKGVELHKSGKNEVAHQLYTAVLKAHPEHPTANYNMGVLAVDVGKVQEALPFFEAALEANADAAQFWLSYIDALINVERIADAQAVLDQAKNNGAKGEGFDQLKQRLNVPDQESRITITASEAHQDQPNILDTLSLYQALRLAKKRSKEGSPEEAKRIYQDILVRFPKNKRAIDALKGLAHGPVAKVSKVQEPPKDQIQSLINLYNQGQLAAVVEQAQVLTEQHPDAFIVWNILGAAAGQIGKLDQAILAFKKVTAIKPDYAEAYNNMGVTLQEQGTLEEAIEVYNKALAIKPDYAEAYSNMGNALKEQGKLEEAIKAYNKALAIKPDYAEAYNNIYFPLQAIKTQISSEKELVSHYPKDTGSKYAQIAKSILNYRLHLGKESVERSLNETLKLLANVKSIIIKNPSDIQDTIGLNLVLPGKVVALTHFGRSGTGLLHSLVDGHPAVSTLPSIYFSEYFDHSTWEKIISSGWMGMADRFMAIYEVLFDASSTAPIETKSNQLLHNIGQKEGMSNVGDQRTEVLSVDKKVFRTELNHLMNCCGELDAFAFFNLVNAAYNKAINDLNPKSLTFYHIHNPGAYAQLNFVRSAPNTNWIMMVREPLQSCESWIRTKFFEDDYPMLSTKIFMMLFEIDNIIYDKQHSVGVRLEDLKERPRQTIPALCKWIGIEETESLYEMTAQGKKWWGDPNSPDFEKDGMNPFGQTSIKRKVGAIFSRNDQFILRTLYYPFSVRFGCVEENAEQFEIDLQTIRPMLDEMFDFEKMIAERTQADPEQFMKSGSYLYLRSGLIERWNTLNEHHTYPNMIAPLRIN